MNDDIKEILQALKESYDETIPKQEFNKCLKYIEEHITNLQQENEKLKELCNKYEEEHNNEFKAWKEERSQLKERYDLVCKISEERKNKWLSLNEENGVLFKIIKDYKARNEYALERLKKDLLNILQGKSDK